MVEKYKLSHPINKTKQREYGKTYYAKNKDNILAKCKLAYPLKQTKVARHNRKYYLSHHESLLDNRKEYRKNNKDKIKTKKYYYEPNKRKVYYMRNKERIKIQSKNKRLEIKIKVMTHYGNGECKCVKCGFDDIRALSIDHINGNGNKERKENKYMRGNHVYDWLKKNNYPLGYQTLCMNCQLIKRVENQEYRFQIKTNSTALQIIRGADLNPPLLLSWLGNGLGFKLLPSSTSTS
jgi:hypothetical protein